MVSSFKPIYFHIPRSEIVEVFFPSSLGCHIASLYCYQNIAYTIPQRRYFQNTFEKARMGCGSQITVER